MEYIASLDGLGELKTVDDSIYYFEKADSNTICKLVISYGSYEIQDVYIEEEPHFTIKSFCLNVNDKLYILCRYKVKKYKEYFLKIVDMKTNELEYKIKVNHTAFIG